jgi:predicted NBD/HSP70 family sugar kinase
VRVKADSDQVRRQNRSLVLEALRHEGPQARIELGRLTRLSPATITAITGDLIAERLIRLAPDAEGDEPASRGRPMVRLELDADAGLVLAIRISIDQILFVVADFAGRIRHRAAVHTATFDLGARAFGARLVKETRKVIRDSGLAVARLRQISIAVQGIADSNRGEIVWSPAFSAQNIPVTAPLEEGFGIDTVVSNDANMIAQGLLGRDPKTYGGTAAIAYLGYGVGMGLIVNGAVYFGPDGQAAEFGHMNHMPGGPLCRCGRRGCLEAYAADYAIYRKAHGGDESAEPSHSAVPEEDMRALEKAAAEGDAAAREAFAQAGRALGFGLARVIALINPRAIALAGPGTRAYPLMQEAMERGLADALVEELRRDIVFHVIGWNQDMITDGIIAGALRHLDRNIFARSGRVASSMPENVPA